MTRFDKMKSNAVKFSNNGSAIATSGYAEDHNAVITVKNSGIGIPEVSHKLAFGRFSQIYSSDYRAHEGTGLGLSIIQQIIEAHGCQIDCESSIGHGTTFIRTLPLQTEKNNFHDRSTQ